MLLKTTENYKGEKASLLILLALAVLALFIAYETFTSNTNSTLVITLSLFSSLLFYLNKRLGSILIVYLSIFGFQMNIAGINIHYYELVTFIIWPFAIKNIRTKLRPYLIYSLFLLYNFLYGFFSISLNEVIIFCIRQLILIVFIVVISYSVEDFSLLNKALVISAFNIIILGYLQIVLNFYFLKLLQDGWYIPLIGKESISRAAGRFLNGRWIAMRPFSFFRTPHINAAILAMLLIFLLRKENLKSRFPLFVLVSGLIQLALCDVRGTILGIAICLALYFGIRTFKKIKSKAIQLLVFLPLCFSLLFILFAQWHNLGEANVGERWLLWGHAINEIFETPIWGKGGGTTALLLSQINEPGLPSIFDHYHNLFLQTMVESGAIGVILFVAFFINIGQKLYRFQDSTFWVLIYFLGHNLVDSFSIGGSPAFMIFFLLLAVGIARNKNTTTIAHNRNDYKCATKVAP